MNASNELRISRTFNADSASNNAGTVNGKSFYAKRAKWPRYLPQNLRTYHFQHRMLPRFKEVKV